MQTSIYLVCFHSYDRQILEGSGQYRKVEQAIQRGEWPYDNGDDPSFFVARKGGPLTWGVCRQNLRTAVRIGSIVVFFSFTPQPDNSVVYRLCAVSTVAEKLDHRELHRDKRFSGYRDLCINGLIAPVGKCWRHDESDRPEEHRHKDWLWRIADHGRMRHSEFDESFKTIYERGWFRETDIGRCLNMGSNYILFDRSYISPNPPEVARFSGGHHEVWSNQVLKDLTVLEAKRNHKRERDFLRVNNSSGRNVHRHIRFDLPIEKAECWRDRLIKALRQISNQQQHKALSSRGTGGLAPRSRERAPQC